MSDSTRALCSQLPQVVESEVQSHRLTDGRVMQVLYYVTPSGVPVDEEQVATGILSVLTEATKPHLLIRVYKLPSEMAAARRGQPARATAIASGHGDSAVALEPTRDMLRMSRPGMDPPIFFLAGHGIYNDVATRLQTERAVITLSLRWKMLLVDETFSVNDVAQVINLRFISESYLALIRSSQPHGPYTLAGMSFGGLVALQIAQMLRSQGETVDGVFMFDTYRPGNFARLGLVRRILAHCAMVRRDGLSHITTKLKARLQGRRNPVVAVHADGEAKKLKVLIDRELGAHTFPADFRYAGKVLLFNPQNREPFAPTATGYGWEWVLDDLDVVKVQGRHHTLLRDSAADIADRISQDLKPHGSLPLKADGESLRVAVH